MLISAQDDASSILVVCLGTGLGCTYFVNQESHAPFSFASAALFVCFLTPLAHASEYYTFDLHDSFFDQYGTFTFVEPSLLTTATSVPSSSFILGSGYLPTAVYFNPVTQNCGSPFTPSSTPGNCIIFDEGPGTYFIFSISSTLLTSEGTYLELSGGGTNYGSVTISSTLPVPSSVTPEPSSYILLGTAVLGISGVARKRFA